MDALNNNPVEISHIWESQILEKVSNYFSIQVDDLLIKYDDSFELSEKWRYGFYVKKKSSWQLFWVFASVDTVKNHLMNITTADLNTFED
jgi:hypothetical protein